VEAQRFAVVEDLTTDRRFPELRCKLRTMRVIVTVSDVVGAALANPPNAWASPMCRQTPELIVAVLPVTDSR
jgi:hypothetical protein